MQTLLLYLLTFINEKIVARVFTLVNDGIFILSDFFSGWDIDFLNYFFLKRPKLRNPNEDGLLLFFVLLFCLSNEILLVKLLRPIRCLYYFFIVNSVAAFQQVVVHVLIVVCLLFLFAFPLPKDVSSLFKILLLFHK